VVSPGVHETHTGIVLLVGDRAYKVKKPVRTSFCDFGSPARRRAALEAELTLNRRLCPDVYIGLGSYEPPARGDAEPVLVMRRMPEDRRLSTLAAGGHPPAGQVRAIARTLAAFHAGAARGPSVDADGGRDALARRWRANLHDLATFRYGPLDTAVLHDVERLSRAFLARRAPLFDARVAEGRIVDGHGDLLADDVYCLDDGPRLLDCLDFDDRLRHVDVLDDVAFLAMDLERLGAPSAAAALVADYREFSGDPAPATLHHHYIAYRAAVRAKVATIRYAQGDPDAAALARTHLELALRHLRAGAVRLVLVGGLPGTGKSTLATALADRTGACVLSSDRTRKELAGMDPDQSAAAAFGAGLYRAEQTELVYDEMLLRAGALLERGESVVLDASWIRAGDRERAAATAERSGAHLVALRCEVDASEAARRIRTRGHTPSDADPAVAARMADRADPWPQARTVRTDLSRSESLAEALRAWEEATERRSAEVAAR
jgi:aminoglycoside phosphotransferase family enzyme/predicted kinase